MGKANDNQLRETHINGRYLLHEEIGRGGMGIVYRATDRITGNIVALKQIKANLSETIGSSFGQDTPEMIRLAFAQEFQILAGLRHPHIVSVLDYGFDAEQKPYITMDLLPEAMTIQDAAQSLDAVAKIDLIAQALHALSYLHRRGVLHKDIKPNNILVSHGRVHLVDFGLSATDRQHSAVSGGTALYMAPEVYHNTRQYSFNSDLYALGIVIYKLFTGEHPFDIMTTIGDLPPIDAPFNYEIPTIPFELRALLQTLLHKDPDARYATAQLALIALNEALGRSNEAESHEIRESFLQAATFVGREQELSLLQTARQKALAGNGSAWLIGGESGVGKSRLIRELRTKALVDGFQVLHGQTVDDGGLPYEVWRVPLRHLVITLPRIDDLTAGVLQPLVPDIAQLLNRSVPPAPKLEEDAAQIRLFTTIARLFWQAERPLLLILEDLHIAEASLLPIPYLARLVTDHHVLILASYSSDERPDLPERLSDMSHLPLNNLSPADIAKLSTAMLGEVGETAAVQSFLQRETEGNAFFAVEVVRALAEEAGRLGDIGKMQMPETVLPNGVQNIVQRRLDRLPPKARQLLLKAAVAGRELETPLIQKLNDGLDIENEWLPLCADTAVLDVQNGVWQFSHGKIRDRLLAELNLNQQQKTAIHNEVALAIEAQHPDDEDQAVRLANHWQEAQNREKERHYTKIAGQQAITKFAHRDALRYFNRALALTPTTDQEEQYTLHLACLTAYRFLRDQDGRQKTLHILADLADSLRDDLKRLEVMHQRGSLLTDIGQRDEAEELFSQVVTLAKSQEHTAIKANALADWIFNLGARRKLAEADNKLAQYQQLAEQLDSDIAQTELLKLQGLIADYKGDTHQAQAYNQSYLRYVQEEENPNTLLTALINLALNHGSLGEFEQAQSNNEKALQLARQIGDISAEALLQNNIGMHQINLGEHEPATAALTASLTLSRQIGDWVGYSYALNNIGMAYYKNGDHEQAEQYLQQAIIQKQALNDPWSEAYTWNHLGHLFSNRNRTNEALAAYKTAESLQVQVSKTTILIETWSGLATTFAQLGNLTEAQVYADKVWAHLQTKGIDGDWAWAIGLLHLHKAFAKLDDKRATAVIQQAHAGLQKRATNIATEASRQKYLTQVPENREIVRLYKTLQKTNPMPVSPHPANLNPEQIRGTINGRYLLHEEIGRGGMGVVYRATDRLTGDIVALKTDQSGPERHIGELYFYYE